MADRQWRLMAILLLAVPSPFFGFGPCCAAGRASAPCGDSMVHIIEKYTHVIEAIYHVRACLRLEPQSCGSDWDDRRGHMPRD